MLRGTGDARLGLLPLCLRLPFGVQKYFESIPGVPPCPPGTNPCSFAMNSIGDGVGERVAVRDFEFEYQVSALALANATKLEELRAAGARGELGPELRERGFAASYWLQLREVNLRVQRQYWRNLHYSFGRLMSSIVLGLLIGSLFWQTDVSTAAGMNARGGQIFASCLLLMVGNAQNVVPQVVAALPVFKRERATRQYKTSAVSIAWGLAEVCPRPARGTPSCPEAPPTTEGTSPGPETTRRLPGRTTTTRGPTLGAYPGALPGPPLAEPRVGAQSAQASGTKGSVLVVGREKPGMRPRARSSACPGVYSCVECVQILYLAVASLVFCAISCTMSGTATASAGQFFQYWFIVYELVLAITFLGMLIAVAVPFPPVSPLSLYTATRGEHDTAPLITQGTLNPFRS